MLSQTHNFDINNIWSVRIFFFFFAYFIDITNLDLHISKKRKKENKKVFVIILDNRK